MLRRSFRILLLAACLFVSVGFVCFSLTQTLVLRLSPRLVFAQPGFSSLFPDGESIWERQIPVVPSVVFHGDRSFKEVALTFDADMTDWMEDQLRSGAVKSYYDPQIPAILTKTNTPATFFLTGEWIEVYPEATKELSRSPFFELASHSYSHPAFHGPCYGLPEIPLREDTEQLKKTQILLETVARVENRFFRFPGGCYAKENVDVVEKAGLTAIDWDVVGGDAFNSDAQVIEKNVLDKAQNGSIIVLHLNGEPNAPATGNALPSIISGLRSKGYTFVTIEQLLHMNSLSQRFDYRRYLN